MISCSSGEYVELPELLRAKLRRLAEEGRIYVPVRELKLDNVRELEERRVARQRVCHITGTANRQVAVEPISPSKNKSR